MNVSETATRQGKAHMTPAISIVVPMYNEEAVIGEMYSRLSALLQAAEIDYEIVMVDDGSRDTTFDIAKRLCTADPRVKLIGFSRNFGHQAAITAGIDKAAGQAVVVIDADLQDPVEVILAMIEKWKEGWHVVYGMRRERKGESWFKLTTAALFYRILRALTPLDIPMNTGDFRLMDRKVVNQLKQMRERARFIRGMVSWVGFRQCKVEYDRVERFAGETKYPLRRMLKFAADGILSFSQIPLKLASAFGFLCSGISFVMMLWGLVIKIFFPSSTIPGWASLFVPILFLGGVQLICLGIIGEYLGRIHEEIKGRPLYIVQEEINFDRQV